MRNDTAIHVIEDDAAMRDALLLLLESAGFQVCGYASAEEFLAGRDCLQPTCLLVDVRLPGMSGLALHRHLLSLGADPAVVMITGHGDIPMAVAALKAGALDFVGKPFDPGVLLDSVRDALRRTDDSRRRNAGVEEIQTRLQTLTAREAETLALLVGGHPNKVIAAKLGVSIRTTEHHRARIMEKMGASTLSQLIKMHLQLGGLRG
jgi:two-component system response regulator FixJ